LIAAGLLVAGAAANAVGLERQPATTGDTPTARRQQAQLE